MTMRRVSTVVACTVLAFGASVVHARAELVFFSSGRSMSVRSVRAEGDRLVLGLRGGGEISCDRVLVYRIEPDEVAEAQPEDRAATARAAVSPEGTADPDPADRPRPFADLINRAAHRYGVDARLVRAVVQVESGYHPRARSRKGAKGLMQLTPMTARQYAVRNAYDPSANLNAGVKHLRGLLDRLPLELALAAYNAGEASVLRFQGIPPYQETRDYVTRVLKLFKVPADTH